MHGEIMTTTEKIWGQSDRLHIDDFIQLERLTIAKGGYSSIHMHRYKWNCFVVQSGTLVIKVFDHAIRLMRTQELTAQNHYWVPPLRRHQFLAQTDVVAYELYWGQPLRAEDILRYTSNGMVAGQADSWRLPPEKIVFCHRCDRPITSLADCRATEFHGASRTICKECAGE